MTVCIHKSLIGTNHHLISQDGEFRWDSSIPEEAWLCGNSDDHPRSLDVLSKSTGVSLSTSPSEAYSTMWSLLRPDGMKNVPMSWALESERFQTHLKQLLRQIDELLSSHHDSYYAREFVTIRQFLQGLDRCKIDKKSVLKILNDESERDGSLRSFIPDDSGFLQKTVYSQTSSCSGRLTVVKGPSILTLRKDRRSLLRSSSQTGIIVQIDFVSLEPRVALSISDKSSQGDIYESIRNNVLGGEVSRDVAKIATISSLYGMSSRKLGEMIGDRDASRARRVLRKIRDHFEISSLEKSLRESSKSDLKIKSHYGRVMMTDDMSNHVLVNRFIQSTATDAALLGFRNLVDEIQNKGIRARPVFVIHDALILDVEKDDYHKLNSVVSVPLELPDLKGTFPVSIEIIAQH